MEDKRGMFFWMRHMLKYSGERTSSVVRPEEQTVARLSKLIADAKPKTLPWLPYFLIFEMVGLHPESMLMAVPFLLKDQDLSIPGIGQKIQVNYFYGNPTEAAIREARENLPDFELKIEDVTRRIPLDPQTVDFFVLNHKVMLRLLEQELKGKKNVYPDEVKRVTKPGGLLMGYDYSRAGYSGAESASWLAKRFSLMEVSFELPDELERALTAKTGFSWERRIEDMVPNPEGYPAVFFRKLR